MTIDTSAVGKQVAEQMEAIENDYVDQDGFKIGPIVTIVGIEGPEGMGFRIRHNVGNPVMALGVIRMAEQEWLGWMKGGGKE
jgi:hypothetical protein